MAAGSCTGATDPIFQAATNFSSLDGRVGGSPEPQFSWRPSALVPHLSILRSSGTSIDRTSPLLQNLSQLSPDPRSSRTTSQHTLIETPLTSVVSDRSPWAMRSSSCVGNGSFLNIRNPSAVGYILSPIGYPESARVKVFLSAAEGSDVSGMLFREVLTPSGTSKGVKHLLFTWKTTSTRSPAMHRSSSPQRWFWSIPSSSYQKFAPTQTSST